MRFNARNSVTHRFFCPRCGEETLPVVRSNSKLRERGHLKMLYCYHCNMTINMVECRDEFEVREFREAFLSGNLAEIVDNSEVIDWNGKDN